MDYEKFLEDRRRALKKSVEFFSTNNKSERERYVCTVFVKNLGIVFDETEVRVHLIGSTSTSASFL